VDEEKKLKLIRTQTAADRQNKSTLICFLTLLIGMLVITFRMVRPYLLAVTAGMIIATLSYRFFLKLRSSHFKPKISALLVTLGVLILVIGPVAMFVNLAIRQAVTLTQALVQDKTLTSHSIFEQITQWGPIKAWVAHPESLERQLVSGVQTLAKVATGAVINLAADIPMLLLQIALAMISCFFFLIDGKKFLNWTLERTPLDFDIKVKIVEAFHSTAISVIWASLAAAGTQSAVILLGFLVLGVPLAFLAAGTTFVFAWIPMIGSTPVWGTATAYLYIAGFPLKAALMLLVGIFTGLVDNFIRPWVLKGGTQLHPLVSLVSIFGGIKMFGIIGVFLGPIWIAILISLLQVWPLIGKRFGLITNTKNLGPAQKISV
jgi:predicted PurR-regulated permease PerM